MRKTTAKTKKETETMGAEFFAAIDMLEATKGIPKAYMLEKIEAALVSAYKKEEGAVNVRISLDAEKKTVRMFAQKTVVEEIEPEHEKEQITLEEAHAISRRYALGDIVEFEVKPKTFGRLSAQTAKQVIIQGIREAEHSNIVREYDKKHEEVISATVTKVNDNTGDVVVDTGTSEAVLLRSEQLAADAFAVGDHLKVFVTEVNHDSESRGGVVTLSRTHPGLVKRMLEMIVPEIRDGIVLIKGISREAGSRTKVAVLSRDADVDAVGACIGSRGMRIAELLEELHGEKIDVVLFSEKPEEYIAAALSPAKIRDVEFDGERSAKIWVDSDQLSLAIGKEGQNARLAAKLTGYKIDIKGRK